MMVSHMAHPAAWAAARRQPTFLPGFDRQTQLAMEFATITFSSAWLRRTFTNENDTSVQACLAAEEQSSRDRRLAEVRYGNNIALLLKACYFLRDFHGSASLWTAISRVFGIKPEVAESVAHLFVEARAKYRSNYSAAHNTAPLITEATHWADKWASFLDEDRTSSLAADSEVFAAVDGFFQKEKQRNGDLAGMLSKGTAVVPPSAPRALRKRSPSPSSLQGTPLAKRISRGTEERVSGSPPGRARTVSLGLGSQPLSHHTQEHLEMTPSTNTHQYQDDQARRTSQQEPYFELKIRGQAQRGNRVSPSHQDRHGPEADGYEVLAQSNMELQSRVDFLEKERTEVSKAQKDRDDAIRTLQARFAAFEKTSAAADAQSSVNNKLVQNAQEMVQKLETQAQKLRQMEKQLELSDQAAQKMQATISSLQKDVAIQARPANDQSGAVTAETKMDDPATIKKQVSEMRVKIMSLEAKSVLFNDLHNNFREIKAQIAAQKDITAAATPDPGIEQDNRVASTRLTAVEEKLGRQDQAVQGMTGSVVSLRDQATAHNSRIACLESRPDTAQEISQLESRVSTVEENQIKDTKTLIGRFAGILEWVENLQKSVTQFNETLGDTVRTQIIEATTEHLTGLQARIEQVEEHGNETSKRLDDMEVSQDALTLHDQSSRIDEITQSLGSLKAALLGLARSDDVETLRAELQSLSQQQTLTSQPTDQRNDALASVTSMVESLSYRMTRLDDLYEDYVTERHNKPEQPFHMNGDIVQHGKQNNVAAVIESLCKRVSVVENGFQIMRDAMSVRRR